MVILILFLTITQYRHPVKTWSLEFPTGHVNDGETLEHAVEREILEETGYRVVPVTLMEPGGTYSDIGAYSECIYMFSCEAEKFETPHRDSGELITVSFMTFDEFDVAVRDHRVAGTTFKV